MINLDLNKLRNGKYDYFPSSMFVKYLLTNTTNYIKLYKTIKQQHEIFTNIEMDDFLNLIPIELINDIINELPKDIYNNALKYAKYYYVNHYGLENYFDNENNDILFNKYLFVLTLIRHDMFESEMKELETEG